MPKPTADTPAQLAAHQAPPDPSFDSSRQPALALPLTVETMRTRFVQPLVWPVELEETFPTDGVVTEASVLIPLVQHQAGLTVLFTMRATHLTDHPGQISFPGGRAEGTDLSAAHTALRETEEEIGLAAQHIEVLGQLRQCVTHSGYRITPIVGLVQPPLQLRTDPLEVAEVFEVPLAFVLDPRNYQRRIGHWRGEPRTFFALPYRSAERDYFIWGATASMLRDLYRLLSTL